jgi:hypothetical protein
MKLRTTALVLAALIAAGAAQAQGMRPEVGKPLQQASELLRAGKAKEALAKVREAEGVPNRTGSEALTIDRMKAAAAQRAGEYGLAIAALESLHGKVSGAEQGQVAEQLAGAYLQTRNNAKASEWLQKAVAAGNTGGSVRQMQQYLQSAGGDYSAIAKDAGAAVAAAEQAGRKPDEGDLLRLADAQNRTGATAGYINTLEKLLFNYPKKDYWSAYLGRLPRKAGFAEALSLDVMRLKLASGTLGKTEEYMELAQLAIQAGLPSEGLKVVDLGMKAGVLGTGAEAERHKRLRDLAVKREAEAKTAIEGQAAEAATRKEGDDLVRVGYAYVALGQADKGIPLIEQGIAKGNLKKPEHAKLRLGQALLGKDRSKAVKTLRSVGGTDGAAEVARLWTLVGG